jgi:uncharacterized membrane protein
LSWRIKSRKSLLFSPGIITLVFGITVIASALMLYMRPQRHGMYGILIIVFSVLSGGIIGVLLGLVGGILALIWKPPTA